MEPVVAADELEAHLLTGNPWPSVAEAGRQLALPEVTRLEDVVID
jgi:hypothetical protein